MATVIVHGGAGAVPDAIADEVTKGCVEAAEKAYQILQSGKSAVDAVEAAVRSLEDNPLYNAGHGSMLNKAGEVEMDAMIADGRTLNYGAVAGVGNISNPISLARMVMEKTSHVMLIGEGANQFAAEMGVPAVDPSALVTPKSRRKWEELYGHSEERHETVGAVARDVEGNFAVAASTGGIPVQMVGRVGDTPLNGAGAFCNDLGGVTCTGHGESIAKVLLAHRVLSQLQGRPVVLSLEEVMSEALEYMLERVGGRGGMIGISRSGEIAKCHTTSHMPWASVDAKGTRGNGVQ